MFAHVVVSTPELDRVVVERNAVRDQLERAIAVYESNDRQHRPLLDLKKFKPTLYTSEVEVDSITFLTRRLHKLCTNTARLQREVARNGERNLSNAAVPPTSPPRDVVVDTEVHAAVGRVPFSLRDPERGESNNNNSNTNDSERTEEEGVYESEEESDSYDDDDDDENDPEHLERYSGTGNGTGSSSPSTYNPLSSDAIAAAQQGMLLVPAAAGAGIELTQRLARRATTGTVATGRRVSTLLADVTDRINAHFLSTTGFVTFKSRRAHITAVKTSILFERFPTMTAQQAPAPIDVIWANMSGTIFGRLHLYRVSYCQMQAQFDYNYNC